MKGGTLGALLDGLLAYKAGRVAPATLRGIRDIIRLHIPDELKAKRLRKLTPAAIAAVLAAVPGSRVRQCTRNVLAEALRLAERDGRLRRNPMDFVPRVRHREKLGRALTRRERAAFERKLAGHPLGPLFRFYLATGCRRSEALAVTREDVDESAGLLHIPGTKTPGSDRYIPLFEPVRELLAGLPRSGPLFTCTPDHATRVFKKLCPAHKLHDLRHTFATWCKECGVSEVTIAEWCGWSSLRMCSRYVHVLSDFERREAAKLKRGW